MFSGHEPIYIQIADQIRQEILHGTLAPGDQVMSTTQYATSLRINPATAAKAFALLVDEGLIHKQRGIGMFVSPTAQQTLRAERRGRFLNESLAPLIQEAALLGIAQTEISDYITAHWPQATTEQLGGES